jgi:hypothetical protein
VSREWVGMAIPRVAGLQGWDPPSASSQRETAKVDRAKRERMWAEARRRCRLSSEAQAMARELGLNPRSLIKNIPSRSEPWKAPVEEWIRDLYARGRSR